MLGKRLKYLRNEIKKTQHEVAESIKISRANYSHFENDRNEPDGEILNRLADYFDVSTDYLLGREKTRKHVEIKQVEKDDLINVPIVGTIKCGPGGIIFQEIEGYSSYPKSDIDSSHEYVVLNAKGDSMIGDGINDGDLALIQKEPEFVQGKIYAVLIDSEETTLKRVTKTDDSVILSPSNPKYDTRVITGLELESFNIIGRLVNIKRNYF